MSAPTLAALRRRSADLPEGCAFRFVERGGAAAPSFNAEDTLAALAHFDAVVYPWAVHEDRERRVLPAGSFAGGVTGRE